MATLKGHNLWPVIREVGLRIAARLVPLALGAAIGLLADVGLLDGALAEAVALVLSGS